MKTTFRFHAFKEEKDAGTFEFTIGEHKEELHITEELVESAKSLLQPFVDADTLVFIQAITDKN